MVKKIYKLILDDPEGSSDSMVGLFGSDFMEYLKAPNYDADGFPIYSTTMEEFQANVIKALKESLKSGIPFIYALDSFDSLTSYVEKEHMEANIKARESGKEVKGSYGMEKPKMASQMFRMVAGDLKKTGSLLIIISQTRDDINPMTFSKKTRSGGNALKFYAHHEMWLAIKSKIPGKNKIPIGINTKVKISKNKQTGKLREIEFPIYYSYGLDNLGSMIDWLVENDYWKESGNSIIPEGFYEEKVTKKALIKIIERDGREKELSELVGQKWNELEEELKIDRKKKYE